ncbi:DUF559 domain-containing protein [Cryobacterium sp. GrIS_2_6]|uniref:DUF559 domain-containing protein n=1 Tax=Cryobacterium sp. GrIS_2_6 TaxID=3162785 RepID=UPI002DFC0BDC|nr:hypothetical protein [Cryobacterium psychrotolerans]
MKRARPLPPRLRETAFTTAEGADAGLSPGRLRRSDLEHPFRGIHASPDALRTIESRIQAYAKRMSANAFFSHVTAAQIHGLPLPQRLGHSMTLHVCTADAAARHGSRRVIGHHSADRGLEVVEVRGVRTTSAVYTWCQLSTLLDLDELIILGDALVRRRAPVAALDQLRRAALRYAGHRGAKKLREALQWVRPGTASARETELRLLLVRAGLPEPELNVEIVDRNGIKIATGDLVYREYRVLVEYDGEQHRTDEEQYHWDVDRLDRLMEEGWRVIRINKSHVRKRPASTIRKVRVALNSRGWTP